MAAAERATIKITATDSLNSCWRLGQTTRRSSARVWAKKPLPSAAMASGSSVPAAADSPSGGMGPGPSGRSGVLWLVVVGVI